ncbi:hypothetical protein UFOVP650_86 [uncultured Caudovirales phage]|uniref:Uncharacterized protein n=1 Tax=uncultured Caudovirales phage TaxID=2100421 RepID=A0A6J5N8E6_9CAUD|nr:hypothetical protein UFOVP650_86 [uncultured Caudovirales phage]
MATVTELKTRAASGDTGALAAVTEIVTSYNAWQDAKDLAKKTNKDAKDRVDQDFAAVKNAIEDSLPTDAGAQTVVGKLTTIEGAWQDYEESKAQATEEKKDAKERVKETSARFERAVKDSAQLKLDLGA